MAFDFAIYPSKEQVYQGDLFRDNIEKIPNVRWMVIFGAV